MSKVKQKLLDIDLDIVEESNGHQLIREGNQTFAGVKTFNKPAHSQMSKPETENTAVNKVMFKNVTRCINTWFEESLTVTEDDITDGYIMLSKDIPPGKESSLEIVSLEGAGPMAYGVHFGAETDRLVLTGYEIERRISPGDQIMVRYAICGEALVMLNGIQDIVYSPELGRFVCTCSNSNVAEIYWSDDGREWTKAFEKEHDKKLDYGFGSGSIDILGLTWNASQSQFTANCYDYDNESISPLTHRWGLTSSDGKTWAEHEGEEFWVTGFVWCNGYCYRTSRYTGEFADENEPFELYRSKDGVDWEFMMEFEEDSEVHEVLGYIASNVYSPESGLYIGVKYERIAVSRDGTNWTEFKPDVQFYIAGWYDGINVLLGSTKEGNMVISRDGLSWWELPGTEMPGSHTYWGGYFTCWAKDKDMMLGWKLGGDVISVFEDFTSNIRGVSRIPIKLETIGTLSLIGGNTGGSGGGSSSSGGGEGGGEGDPIDLPFGDDGYYHKPYPDFPGRPKD